VSAPLVATDLPAVGRGVRGDDTDDLGLATERLACRDDAANSAAEADRHIDDIEVGHGAEQLQPIARDAAHQKRVERAHRVEVFALGHRHRVLVSGLEIAAVLDEMSAKALHRPVLFRTVAVRHDNHRLQAQPRRRIGDALPVIAGRRADDAGDVGLRALQIGEVDEAATQLKGAGLRVVLVLDPELGADPLR
jgi:hypothetical protein